MKAPKPLTIVIKLGTSSIVDEKTHQPLLSILSLIVETAVKLRKDGHKVIIVSSGAIGVGLRRMEMDKRPKHLPRVQALAAIGQCRLMSLWDSLFAHLKQPIAQILLTRNDIADRSQYLNAQNTINELLEMGVIPIVNENDTLAVSEIKFGDNDTLSAITAAMVHADFLFLMTDVDCLYDKNPRTNTDARAIEVVDDISGLQADVSSAGSSLGTGGMSTKIVAARLATSAGVTTIITRSSSPGNIDTIVQYIQFLRRSALSTGHSHSPLSSLALSPSKKSKSKSKSHSPPDNSPGILEVAALASPDSEPKQPEPEPKTFPITAPLHTRFTPSLHPIRDRHFWLLHGLAPHGTIYIDAGAHLALSEKAGLLPVGVIAVEGNFAQQEAVRIVVVERGPDPSVIGTDAQAPSPQNGNGHAVNGHAVAAALAVAAASRIPHAADPSDPFTTTTTAASKPLTRTTSSADLLTPHAPSSPHALYHGTPREVGRALVNYSAAEIARIKGLQSHDIVKALGYADSEYVALRENISLGLRR